MKRRLLEYQRDRCCRPSGSCVLVLAFLLLPYLIDVTYYSDSTPTDYAQENPEEGKDSKFADKQLPVPHHNTCSSIGTNLPPPGVHAPCSFPAGTVLIAQYLFVTSITSRPPPVI